MIQHVKDEIIAAFADVPRPTILTLPSEEEWEEATIALQNLSGKDWKDIDSAFLSQNRAAFYGLTAEAYQYYLPARMICSLDDTSETREVTTYTVLSLLPNFWFLLYEGRDETFDYETSNLTEQQRYAVCSFLETLFDEPTRLKFWSAQCLRWGWKAADHPATAKMREFYRELTNFSYPPAITPKNQELIDLIRSSFEDTPPPDVLSSHEMFRKGDPEGPDFVLEFRGLDWRTLHPNYLSWMDGALNFLRDEEFRYFLPAYLIAEIWERDQFNNDQEDIEHIGSNHDPVFPLTHNLTKPFSQEIIAAFNHLEETGLWPDDPELKTELKQTGNEIYMHKYTIKRFSKFTPTERKAIIAYLEYRAIDDEYSRDEINNAIEYYWSKTV